MVAVSILTRPQGRVLLGSWRQPSVTSKRFQSSPAHRDGCCRPLVRPKDRNVGVSILTRPQGRVLPTDPADAEQIYPCFNPHPPTGTGAAFRRAFNQVATAKFQSSPAHRDGCCRSGIRPLAVIAHIVSILTRPQGRVLRRRPGSFPRSGASVSILTRPQGRVLRCLSRCRPRLRRVSILTRPQGRVLPRARVIILGRQS